MPPCRTTIIITTITITIIIIIITTTRAACNSSGSADGGQALCHRPLEGVTEVLQESNINYTLNSSRLIALRRRDE